MCRITTAASPPPSLLRKRSSFSSTSSTSSSSSSSGRSTTTTNGGGLPKRVSFSDTIQVYSLEPIGKEMRGQVFYCSDDYRRFRSDSCLELLEEQLLAQQRAAAANRSKNNAWGLIFHRLATIMATRKASAARNKLIQIQQSSSRSSPKIIMKPEQLPWMTPYYHHPHDDADHHEPQAVAPVVAAATGEPSLHVPPPQPNQPFDCWSRETRVIEELAFLG